jgi:hypothetical protein
MDRPSSTGVQVELGSMKGENYEIGKTLVFEN